ncbi:hypothetical protein JCM8097_003465 [Rhodosporidiobolus ruineniae]
MFDGLLEALSAPLRDMLHRLAHSSVEFPDLQPAFTLFAVTALSLACVGTLLAACVQDDVYYTLWAAGFLAADVALVAGLVWSVPPETSEVAATFHALWTFFTHISLVFNFAYMTILVILEVLLQVLIAVSAILLRAVPIFVLVNASVCLMVAWWLAAQDFFGVFCSWVHQLSYPSLPQNPAEAAHLPAAAQAVIDARHSHQVALQAGPPSLQVRPRSEEITDVQRVWVTWFTSTNDEMIRSGARRLVFAIQHSRRKQPLLPVQDIDAKYTFSAAYILAHHVTEEHRRRYDYSQTTGDKLYQFFQRLAGVLLQTFCPLPSLRPRFASLDNTLLLGLLFTPLMSLDFPEHPDRWASNDYSTERIEPDTSPALDELVTAAVRYLHGAFGPKKSSANEVTAIEHLGAVLVEAETRWELQRAEKTLERAVLDAVLLWKARKEGRRGPGCGRDGA